MCGFDSSLYDASCCCDDYLMLFSSQTHQRHRSRSRCMAGSPSALRSSVKNTEELSTGYSLRVLCVRCFLVESSWILSPAAAAGRRIRSRREPQ